MRSTGPGDRARVAVAYHAGVELEETAAASGAGPRVHAAVELEETAAASGAGPRVHGEREALQRGDEVGRYVLLGQLGAGGMGVVYAAYDPELDRKVAIKLVLPARDGTSEGGARLLREAQALARLAHPNVVTVHDVGTRGEQVWIAMEFVAGETLTTWASRPRRWQEALAVLTDVARGVAAAHAAGLVHRDLKPDNVMIGEDGRVRVMDFGLAHGRAVVMEGSAPETLPERVEGSTEQALRLQLTAIGAVQGTPAYMAPEQWSGEEVQAAADQFGWCVMAWELLFGERPYAGETRAALLDAVLAERRRPPPRGRRVPGWLRRVVERGLACDPRRRWPSMAAVLAALERGRGRARVRVGSMVLASVAALGGAVEAVRRWDTASRVAGCEAAGATVEEVWNDEVKRAVRAAFVATGASYAETAADKVMPWLDEQARGWRAARTSMCMRTEVERTWGAELGERAGWCLDERRMAMAALVAEFVAADATTVQKAVAAAASGGMAGSCLDEESLGRAPPPPDEGLEALAEVRAELSRSHARVLAGDYAEALAAARAAEQVEVGWGPLRAAVQAQVGAALRATGAFEEAERALTDGYFAAAGAGAWDTATEAATTLIVVVGLSGDRPVDGFVWGRHAALAIDHGGDPAGLREAARLANLALVHEAAGEYAAAVELGTRALADSERVLGGEHLEVALRLAQLANMKFHAGSGGEAAALLERAVAVLRATVGSGHPDTAASLHRLASVEAQSGALEKARALGEEALAIRREALGPGHMDTAKTLNNLGLTRMFADDHVEAIALFEQACAIYEKELGPEHPELGRCLDNLASVHMRMFAYPKSLALQARAQAIFERSLGGEHPSVGLALMNRGLARRLLGEHAEAIDAYSRALPILRKAHGELHENVVVARTELGRAYLAAGRLAEARAMLAEVVAIREAHPGANAINESASYYAYARLHLAEKDLAGARTWAGRGLAIAERELPAGQEAAEGVALLGAIALAARSRGEATRELERAVAMFAAIDGVEAGEPPARFELARVLLAGDRARALEQARAALVGYRGLGLPAEVAKVERWLSERG